MVLTEGGTIMDRRLFFIIAASAAMFTTSCQNRQPAEPEPVPAESTVFTAYLGDLKTKTAVSTNQDGTMKVNWEGTDLISVNGSAYCATPDSENPAKATFELCEGQQDAQPVDGYYTAYYPETISDGTTAVLPASITYAAGKFNMQMYARSSSTTLSFRNICAVMAITVTSAQMPAVSSITVSSGNHAMSGAFTVTTEGEYSTAVLTDADATANHVTMTCSVPVATSEQGTVFYIPVPAQTYTNLLFKVSDGSVSKYMATRKDAEIQVAVNVIYPIVFSKNIDYVPESEGLDLTELSDDNDSRH